LSPTGKHLEDLFPKRMQLWLYRWALDRGHLDTVLDRAVIHPLMRLSRFFSRVDGLGLDRAAKRQPEAAVPLHISARQGGNG
jgi:hypothetical protein